jgi:hypothetical protein
MLHTLEGRLECSLAYDKLSKGAYLIFLNEQARDSADFIDREEGTERGRTNRPLHQPQTNLAKGSTLTLWPPPLSRPKPHL